MNIQENVNLASFNSFGVASQARHFGTVTSVAELEFALDFAEKQRLPVHILGGGSNTLFVADYPGLVLRIAIAGIEPLEAPGQLRIGAGEKWHHLFTHSLKKELYGLENLALIPGLCGAAPIQNIGAYGVELEQFFVSLEAFNLATREIKTFDDDACEFGYRDSLFKQPGNPWVVLSLTLQLHTEPAPVLTYPALVEALGTATPTPQQIFDSVCAIRSSKLPDPAKLGNAGSFFKNPVVSRDKYQSLKADHPDLPCYDTEDADLVKLPAAWLLDTLGWKGRQRGSAAVHDQHALVLVNPGDASGEDILLLAQEMSTSVLEKFGIALVPEVHLISG